MSLWPEIVARMNENTLDEVEKLIRDRKANMQPKNIRRKVLITRR